MSMKRDAARALSVAMLATLLALPGGGVEAQGGGTTMGVPGYSLEPLWETDGFSMPESVVSIPGHPWLYVSNVNGEDAPGFISRLTRDGRIDALKWVDGIQAPTGMAAFDGHIFVVDQSRVHKIALETGKIVQTFESAQAKTLNDIALSETGEAFISDLTGGAIHTIDGDALALWKASESYPLPNGVLVQGGELLVSNWGSELAQSLPPEKLGALYRVGLADKDVTLMPETDKLGSFDGLAPFGDGFLASNPMSQEMYYLASGQKSLLGKISGGVADIGTDPEAGLLFAPLLFANKVAAFRLEPRVWTRLTTRDTFLEHVVDAAFGDEGGQSIAHSDGTITGTFGGQTLAGTWDWSDDMFCRTSTLGEQDLGHDCLVIDVTDTQMRLTLRKGMGPSIIYDRK